MTFPLAPVFFTDPEEHRRRIALAANEGITGRNNNIGTVTLTASSATTTLTDASITAQSQLYFTPTTANAAAEVGAGGFYVSAKADGSATLTHANNAQNDRTFDYMVVK